MTRSKMNLVLGLLFAALASPSAFAGPIFSVAGALNYGLNTNGGTAPLDQKGGLGYGGGLLIGLPLGPMVSFQVGGIYLIHNLTSSALPTVNSGWVHVPGSFLIGLSHSFALNLGGYYATQISAGNSPITGQSDYGALGGIRLNFGMGGKEMVFIDATYNYGLKNGTDYGVLDGVGNKQVIALIGLSFGGGGK